jgi:hypothetical protein
MRWRSFRHKRFRQEWIADNRNAGESTAGQFPHSGFSNLTAFE